MKLLYFNIAFFTLLNVFCLVIGSSLPTGTAPLKKMSDGKELAASVRQPVAQIISFVILKKVKQYRDDAQVIFENMPSAAVGKFHTLQEKQAWIEAWRAKSHITPFNNCHYDCFESVDLQKCTFKDVQFCIQNKYEEAKSTERAVGKWFLNRGLVISQERYDQNEQHVNLLTSDQFLGEITELLARCQQDTYGTASKDFFQKCLHNLFESVPKNESQDV